MTDYGSILRNIGYNLIDRGSYWQTNAIFRNGDNKTSIRIYKDTGVWSDFVEGNKPLPFETLLKKTLKTNDVSKYIEQQNTSFTFYKKIDKLLKEEKTFHDSCLKKLLPDRHYFESRGIPSWVQEEYQCGLATSGKLYQRIVFPVRRNDGKIHGFIGRKVVDNKPESPKWLNFGKTCDWFYPYFSVEGVEEQIEEEKRVFVIESIGDSMSLYRSGVKNNIVCFTNNIKPKITSRLSNLSVDIVLSLNNDSGQNRGFDGALASFIKLADTIDLERIWFCPPPVEDFGMMNDQQIREWRSSLDFSNSSKESLLQLIGYAPKAKLAANLLPKLKKIEKSLE
jgi:hypothetical protein